MMFTPHALQRRSLVTVAVAAALTGTILIAGVAPAEARVVRIVIDQTLNNLPPTGVQTVAYQTINGRAFGELCISGCQGAANNTIITDLGLAPHVPSASPLTPGATVVQYVASFSIVKPTDNSNISGILWHDVPNRGGRIVINIAERGLGDVGLSSGWQGDNAGATGPGSATTVPSYASSTIPVTTGLQNNEWVKTPVATGTTGLTLARIINRSGAASQALNVMGNPIPYLPASLNTAAPGVVLTTHTHETLNGNISVGSVIPSTDWAFAHCDATNPFPGTPQDLDPTHLPGSLPVHVCLRNGFDPTLLYQLVYQVKDPYVLGAGTAAFRDVGSFFRYAAADDFGTANPIAGTISKEVIRGVSQSGNFTRHYIHLGMNQDEAGRIVHDGAWPIIAGRRVANNSRWGQPDGVLELYQQGSEGPQWWTPWPDTVRGLPAGSILDRCNATNTCPKIIEHFGGSEVFALKMTTEWVGTSADADIPLPANVRRYYVPSTTHGGGGGGFNENISPTGANCPGNNWNAGQPAAFRPNPVSETELTNVLRLAMRNWITNGTPPPPSRFPTLAGGTLVDPTQAAMGFPSGVPGVPASIFLPENFVNPVFDYDWGPLFNEFDATGVPTNIPPPIKSVIKMKVPKVDADGNELGGVPTVLRDAPLGTYLGWNITTTGFHVGQVCNYVGGMIPFAHTRTERLANGDPRLSLEERYGSHNGYVSKVSAAALNAFFQGYLLKSDVGSLVSQAQASNVCAHGSSGQSCDPAAP
jgi:Alpha/beta hydrolase domain